MRRFGAAFKTWKLMVAVAIMGVGLAATRVESARPAAIVIVGSCIGCLAHKRYAESVALRRERGLPTSPAQKVGKILASVTIAVVVIGVSDIAFFVGCCGFLWIASEVVVASHWSPYSDEGYMAVGGIIGMTLALRVASSLRRTIGSPQRTESGQPRRWRKPWRS